MKTLTYVNVMAATACFLVQSDLAYAHNVSNAKIAELSLHRMERLVVLKKIPASFETQLKGLRVDALPHQDEDEPAFKVTLSQYPGSDGTSNRLEIVLDEEGRSLSFVVKPGADAIGAPTFPDKNATVLAENSLHFLEAAPATHPELGPFEGKLTSLSIAMGTNSSNESVAVIDIAADGVTGSTRILLKLNGAVESYQVLP